MSQSIAEPNRGKRRPGRAQGITVIACFAIVAACAGFQRMVLVDPPPIIVPIGFAIAGLVLGIWGSRSFNRARPDRQTGRDRLTLVAIPLLAAFAGSYLAYFALATIAFDSDHSTRLDVVAQVVGKDNGRKGPRSAKVRLGPESREISIPVDSALYGKLDPYRSPGRDCLLLRIERSRSGVRRAIIPNLTLDKAWGVERYRRC